MPSFPTIISPQIYVVFKKHRFSKKSRNCKVSRQEFYAGGLTRMISLGNMPISKVVKFSDDFPRFLLISE
jgi:hypothetical protein